jgi:hypothetical protein
VNNVKLALIKSIQEALSRYQGSHSSAKGKRTFPSSEAATAGYTVEGAVTALVLRVPHLTDILLDSYHGLGKTKELTETALHNAYNAHVSSLGANHGTRDGSSKNAPEDPASDLLSLVTWGREHATAEAITLALHRYISELQKDPANRLTFAAPSTKADA